MHWVVVGLALVSATEPSVNTRACAHRGDVKHAPENTVPAMREAVRRGAHQIEFDLQLSKDGRLIVLHDATVDRTTNGTGRAAGLTFTELRALDAGGWFGPAFAGTRIPTFREVLAVIPHPILCNVHLKNAPGVAEAAAKAIVEMGRLDHCFLAATLEQAVAARTVAPDIRICNMSRQGGDRDRYVDGTIEAECAFIQLAGGVAGLEEAVARLHAHNVTVNYFGAQEESPIRRLVDVRVDYILTDDLDLCLAVLADYGVSPVDVAGVNGDR